MKFEWGKIPGFKDGMTAEEKLALLDSYEEPETEKKIPKAQFDALASELAKAKKDLKSRMTEDEQKEADRTKQFEDMQKELDGLKHEKTVSGYKASMLGLGMAEDSAAKAAEALASGNMADVFAALKTHKDGLEKSIRAEIMKNSPKPPAGDEPGNEATASEAIAKQITGEAASTYKSAEQTMNYYLGGKTE